MNDHKKYQKKTQPASSTYVHTLGQPKETEPKYYLRPEVRHVNIWIKSLFRNHKTRVSIFFFAFYLKEEKEENQTNQSDLLRKKKTQDYLVKDVLTSTQHVKLNNKTRQLNLKILYINTSIYVCISHYNYGK